MADFMRAYLRTAAAEGGYADVPGDAGGETYAGITRRNFPAWKGWAIVDAHKPLHHGALIRDDGLLALVQRFYKVIFWDSIGGDELDDQPTAERLYDFGVNAGVPRSLKQIQEILGIPQTGRVDDATIAAINHPAQYLAT